MTDHRTTSMRGLIRIVESLTTEAGTEPHRMAEAIVYRDRYILPGNDRRTIVAVNPTKLEWDRVFPKGAAGVYCKDGRVAVGDGNCLAHDVILHHANIAQSAEKYRLQLCRTGAWVELWLDKDEWEDRRPTKQEVLDETLREYGETIEQIEAQVRPALQRFMGDVPVRVIPMSTVDQEGYRAADRKFITQCVAAHRALCGT